jgi:hypothetical protein
MSLVISALIGQYIIKEDRKLSLCLALLEKGKKVDLHGEHEGGEPVVVPNVQADGRLL